MPSNSLYDAIMYLKNNIDCHGMHYSTTSPSFYFYTDKPTDTAIGGYSNFTLYTKNEIPKSDGINWKYYIILFEEPIKTDKLKIVGTSYGAILSTWESHFYIMNIQDIL